MHWEDQHWMKLKNIGWININDNCEDIFIKIDGKTSRIYLDLNYLWLIGKTVCLIKRWNIIECCLAYLYFAITMMNVSKDMCFWLYFIYFLSKFRAACVYSIRILVQYLIRWSMGDQKVYLLRNSRPKLLCPWTVILKSPVIEKWLVWRPKYF
jgi:hypothetical protein